VPKPPPTIITKKKAKLIKKIETVLEEQGYNVLIKRKQLKKGKGS